MLLLLIGPIPAWASLIASWYNYLWSYSRTSLISLFFLVFIPYLQLLSLLTFTLPLYCKTFQPISRYIMWPLLRWTQRLLTGVVVCFFESMSKTRFSFSGKVDHSYWTHQDQPSTTASTSSAHTVDKSRVNVYVSNQTSYTSFVDVFVFYCLNYRRQQYSDLYVLPINLKGWSLLDALLYRLCLSPLTLSSSASIDLLLNWSTSCCSPHEVSFVWFPESTADSDVVTTIPLLADRANALSQELLHVKPPRLSQCLVHIVASTICSGAMRLNVLESTITYTGSVQAELEAKYEDDLAVVGGSSALTDAEEMEFESELKRSNFSECDVDESRMDGYSAETINEAAHGTITSQLKRKYEATIPVFCTAAPLNSVILPAVDESSSSSDNNNNNTSSSFARPIHSPHTRAALLRSRVVPTYHSFLSGNPPSVTHVLLNQLDEEYLISRVLNQDCIPADRKKASKPSAVKTQLTAQQEQSSTSSSQLIACLDSWLLQRFLHQEQQLSLFAIHSCFHSLPSSLSASSIPVSLPIEAYSFPVSTVWTSIYALVDWVLIVATVVAIRNTRAWLNRFSLQL